MIHEFGFHSKNAKIKSLLISKSANIFGTSIIEPFSIIDSYVNIGYPVRSKIKELPAIIQQNKFLEDLLDQISTGSIIGKNNHIRPYTIIYENTILADEVETGTNVLIREECKIGEGSVIGSNTIFDSRVFVGKKARIQSNNFIPPGIELGDNVFLGPSVRFANDKYPVSTKLVNTKVEDNVIIGIGSIILPGLVIHKNSVIAAGSIVTKNVKESDVVMGCPAKHIMSREEYNLKKEEYETN